MPCTVEDCQRELAGFQKTKKVLSNLFGKHKKARQPPSIPPLHPQSKKRADTVSDTPSPVAVEGVMSTSCHAALPNEGTGPSFLSLTSFDPVSGITMSLNPRVIRMPITVFPILFHTQGIFSITVYLYIFEDLPSCILSFRLRTPFEVTIIRCDPLLSLSVSLRLRPQVGMHVLSGEL
ncbi:unnamed protein product [Dibothriocephalus latus]|uniref:Uncharacterized protein n=1 Tax=Dibothriocephalus latus TaxID=60516 RepID=A0A3P7PQN9_DIBLA|nr:unnamed protein product [Dibothriocephalus latus]